MSDSIDGIAMARSIDRASEGINSGLSSIDNTLNGARFENTEGLNQLKDATFQTVVKELPGFVEDVYRQLSLVISGVLPLQEKQLENLKASEEERINNAEAKNKGKNVFSQTDVAKLPASISASPLFLGVKISDLQASIRDNLESLGSMLETSILGLGEQITAGGGRSDDIKNIGELMNASILDARDRIAEEGKASTKNLGLLMETSLKDTGRQITQEIENCIKSLGGMLNASLLSIGDKLASGGESGDMQTGALIILAGNIDQTHIASMTEMNNILNVLQNTAGNVDIDRIKDAAMKLNDLIKTFNAKEPVPTQAKMGKKAEFVSSIQTLFGGITQLSTKIAPVTITLLAGSHIGKLLGSFLANITKALEQVDANKVKKAEKATVLMEKLQSTFLSVRLAAGDAIRAGLLAIPATLLTLLIYPFLAASLLVFGFLRFFKDVQPKVEAAQSMAVVYRALPLPMLLAIAAGVLAMPAAIGSILSGVFIFASMFLFLGFMLLTMFPMDSIKQTAVELRNIFISTAIAMAAAVIIALLFPMAIAGLLGFAVFLGLVIMVGLIGKLGLVFIKGLAMAALQITAAVLLIGIALILTIFFFRIDMMIPALKGILVMLVIMAAFTILGLLAMIAAKFIKSLALVSLLILASVILFSIALRFVLALVNFISENFGGESPFPGIPPPFGGLLAAAMTILPLAIIIIAFAIVGIIALIAVIPMVGLLLFSLIALAALPLLARVVAVVGQVLTEIGQTLTGGGEDGGLAGLFGAVSPALAPLGGFIQLLLKLLGLILIIVLIAVVGIVASIATPFIGGLKRFAEVVPEAMQAMAAALPAINTVVSATGTFLSDAAGDAGGIAGLIGRLSPDIGGLISVMGRLMSLTFIIGAIGILGIVAAASEKYITSLSQTSKAIVPAMQALYKAIPKISEVIIATNNLLSASQEGAGDPGIGQRIRGFFQGDAAVNSDAAQARIMSIGALFKALAKVGEVAQAEAGGIMGLTPASNKMLDVCKSLKTMIDNVVNLSKDAEHMSEFKMGFEESVLKPLGNLSEPINKLRQVSSEINNLNSALSALTRDNMDTLKHVSQLGHGSAETIEAMGALFIRLGRGGGDGGGRRGGDMDRGDPAVERIQEDVHAIANKLIAGDPRESWTMQGASTAPMEAY